MEMKGKMNKRCHQPNHCVTGLWLCKSVRAWRRRVVCCYLSALHHDHHRVTGYPTHSNPSEPPTINCISSRCICTISFICFGGFFCLFVCFCCWFCFLFMFVLLNSDQLLKVMGVAIYIIMLTMHVYNYVDNVLYLHLLLSLLFILLAYQHSKSGCSTRFTPHLCSSLSQELEAAASMSW